MNKIYCSECEHMKKKYVQVYSFYDSSATEVRYLCSITERKEKNTPIRRKIEYIMPQCEEKNKHNDCKDFTQKVEKVTQKAEKNFVRKILELIS